MDNVVTQQGVAQQPVHAVPHQVAVLLAISVIPPDVAQPVPLVAREIHVVRLARLAAVVEDAVHPGITVLWLTV